MADRQQIIETNRSIRTIKNELESLLEKGVLTDDAFDTINSALPSETPLSGASRVKSPAAQTPVSAPAAPTPAAQPVSSNPPSYESSGPPGLPIRGNPPPPQQPIKPILTHARALYRYQGADARDLYFEKDDGVAVLEYVNPDWWMGRNLRTGQEGIFPRSYVHVDVDEKMNPGMAGGYGQQPAYHQNGPAAPMNPYDAHAPPMAIAEGEKDSMGNKVSEGGKKFGKKLGNAAIFGAGATIGSNIVNSIF